MADRLILMGVIGKPHGVRGAVRVHSHAEDADTLAGHTLTDRKGRRFQIVWAHENVAWIDEVVAGGKRRVATRTEAEALTNTELFIARGELPETEAEEFYFTDLIGLEARTSEGKVLGKIAEVLDFGAGASLELAPSGALIPFTRACVPVVNVAAGFVVVNPPREVAGQTEATP
ncbi:ribosome maturation factor RimM [Acidocella sp.]|uniref:ribosome maturation factor RimM n=1 Tax=Acidocella sp. TaxID=50710 RepID=UPI002617E024|nr:ribosome maturation factor RimM [Acidocella sp.]